MFVHVQNLPLHCHEKQNEEVHEQDRPEDWNIKDWEEGHEYASRSSSCASHPELELG